MTGSTGPRPQRRGRAIAMTSEEVDRFLAAERTCRVATVGPDGDPHVTPVWFVWDGTAVWLNSLVRSQRWADIARRADVAVVVDGGTEFAELRGVQIAGSAVVVGEVPRGSTPIGELEVPERLYARKYGFDDGKFAPDGRHAWLRVEPKRIVSWDFRKLATS